MEKEEKSSDIHTFFKNFIQLSRIEKFRFNKSNNKDLELFVKRDDLIHKYISGNKIRKLNQNIFSFYKNKCEKLVTFGGAFSNHLLATASMCYELGIPCIGFNSKSEMKSVLNNVDLWNVIKDKIIVLDDFHFGGYAKSTNELRDFISEINQINEMQIEEVYTGKALYALKNYLEKNFVKNKKVLFIHTGGIFTDKN